MLLAGNASICRPVRTSHSRTVPSRLPVATHHDRQVIVFCSEGYTSSLAAAALQDLGLYRATDMVGGFQAWRAMGLPIVPPSKM